MIKQIIFVLSIGLTTLSFSSCGTTTKATDSHNSQNSLDWAGVYQGTLPCADCEGIQSTLWLQDNGQYKFRNKYLGVKTPTSTTDSGKFIWEKDGQTISLSQGGKYMVGENQLFQLDGNGKKITGALASHFILIKMPVTLKETYWQLVALNGKNIQADSQFNRVPHLILKDSGSRAIGNAGCNQFFGGYTTDGTGKISFSKMGSTMMACPNLGIENQFTKALSETTAFQLNGEELKLMKGDSVLATFKAVLLR